MEWSVEYDSPDPKLRTAKVENLNALDRALDRAAEEGAKAQPLIVEFVSPSGARFGIGVGMALTVLSFKASDEPPYFISVGYPESCTDHDIGFYFQGRWTEFPASALVSTDCARNAARRFFATGHRPDNIRWEEV